MKNKPKSIIILLLVLILLIIGFLYYYNNPKQEKISSENSNSIIGCYIASNTSNIFSLNIKSQEDQKISGLLSMNFSEKDSSTGIINGNFDNLYLFGKYTFLSEGITSTLQVAFKKSGNDFVRGYGPLNEDGTSFKNINLINYDATSPLNVFKKVTCHN